MKRASLEGTLCAIPYRPFVRMKPPSRSAYHVSMTASGSPVYRCSTCWSLGRPEIARMWRGCWGFIATPSAAGWHGMPPGGWTPCWRRPAPRAHPSRSPQRCSPAWNRPSAVPKASPRLKRYGNGCDRRMGWRSRPNTLDTLVRMHFKATLKVARRSHTKNP